MKTKTRGLFFAIISVIFILAALAMLVRPEQPYNENADICEFCSSEAERLSVVKDGKTDFVIRFSSDDSLSADSVKATEMANLLSEYGVYTYALPDLASSPQDYEILLGTTDRVESKDLYKEILAAKKGEDDLAWGYYVTKTKILFTASSTDAFNYGFDGFLSYLKDCSLSPEVGTKYICAITSAEYEEILEAGKNAEKQKYLEELIATNAKFTQADFGGAPKEMPTNKYESPLHYPASDQHPRLFFTEDKIDDIYQNLLTNPEFDELRKRFWGYANAENFTGIFPDEYKNGKLYHFNQTVLAQLEAKALAYILTGDEVYGYEAIIGAKNVMLSLHYIKELHADTYHGASQTMVNVAKVYDWCYDLLSEDDKQQIIAGVSNVLAPQMEAGMQFPPSGMNGISGHGTGPQFTRDWVTVSLAFYDEMPSWWEFVGGRYYEEYVPVINYCYQGGYASQGTVTYGDSKYFTKGWAGWLIKNATGEFPYVENFHLGAYYYFSHLQSNGYYFQTGDGNRNPKGCAVDPCYMFIAAALFDDPIIASMAKKYTNDYTKFSYAFTMEYTVCDVLIFHTYGPDPSEYTEEDLKIDLIQYLDFPAGTMTARNSWDEDGAVVLMRIANMTMSNHDLADHGTFQIYYKGLLAGSSGAYNKYGSYTHKYYLQATIAHNGLLMFNPALSDDEPIRGTNETCKTTGCTHEYCILNAKRYYYSGSQRSLGEAGTIENWLSGNYDMADVYGADWGYDLKTGEARFAYIAGDLTRAYDSNTVDYIGRKMLTVFTDDPTYPMLFFTYDQMTAVAGGEGFTKTFLLHTVKEPVIDTENLTATVTEGEGRLFLHSISGAQTISKVGGPGQAYWINGKNCWNDGYTFNDNADKIWGRIELSSVGNLSDSFLTAMYVTDSENDEMLDIKKLENESVEGLQIMNNIIVFTKSNALAQTYSSFSFTTEGDELYTYYVAGLEAGTWQVFVDGVTVAWAYSEENGGIITFTAPVGEVTLAPGRDVIGLGGGKIKYNTLGGILPDDAPMSYTADETTVLPETIVRGTDIFLGWYMNPGYDEDSKITEVPSGMTGTLTVYARYLSTLLDADFTSPSVNVNVSGRNDSKNVVGFSMSKTGASCISKTDKDGVKYVEWKSGEEDSIINYTSKYSNYSTMSSDDECATITVTLSRDGTNPMTSSDVRIYTKKNVAGEDKTTRLYIFSTNTAGEVKLGDSSEIITTLTEKPITLRFVIDFKNESLSAYDEGGALLASKKLTVDKNSGAQSMSEWRKLLDSVVFYWYGNGSSNDTSMRIYKIKVSESDTVNLERSDTPIIFSSNGGRMPDGFPKDYGTNTPTDVSSVIPERDGFVFCGWYTSADFKDETLVNAVGGNGKEGEIRLYAKWEVRPDALKTDLDGGKMTVTPPKTYDPVLGTDISGLVPEKKGYVFGGWYTEKSFSESSRVDGIVGIGCTEPITIYAKWLPPKGTIIYDLGGGTLADNSPTMFSNSASTELVSPTKVGSVFAGWYTSPTFDENTKIEEIPASDADYFYLYAKWVFTVYEDFTSAQIDITASQTKLDSGVVLAAKDCTGASFKTVTDESGATYLEWIKGEKDPRIIMNNGLIAGCSDTSISYEIVLAKNGTAPLPHLTFRTTAKVDVHGDKLASNNALYMFGLDETGAYISESGANKFNRGDSARLAQFDENGKITIRVEIDFAAECIIGYRPDGTFVVTPLAIPESSGAKNGLEYMKTFTEYVFYLYAQGASDSAVRVYSIRAESGKIFSSEANLENLIIYEADGGALPDGAPTNFDTVTPTVLPIPTRDRAVFLGWYTSPDFEEGTLVTEVPTDAENFFTVYAKWEILPDDDEIFYDLAGGALPNGAPTKYSKDESSPTALPTPTKKGFRFVGWYTSPDFTEASRLDGVIPPSYGDCAYLYAKWCYEVIEDYSVQPDINVSAASVTAASGIVYNATNSGSFTTKTDSAGNKYVEWAKGENDPMVTLKDGNVAKMQSNSISYVITIARNSDGTMPSTQASIRAQYDVNGNKLASSVKFQLFGTDDKGNIYLGGAKTAKIGTVPEYPTTESTGDAPVACEPFELRITLNFEARTLTAYTNEGTTELSFNVPAETGLAADDGVGFKTLMSTYTFYWQASKQTVDTSLRIYGISVIEGNAFAE